MNLFNASIKKIIDLELWNASLRLFLEKSLIWSSGEPRLRLVNFLKAYIEKIIDSELWRAQAQTGQFP